MPSRVKTREFGFLETFVRRMLGTTDKNRHQKSRLCLSAVNTGNLNHCHEKKIKKNGNNKQCMHTALTITLSLTHNSFSNPFTAPQPVKFPG